MLACIFKKLLMTYGPEVFIGGDRDVKVPRLCLPKSEIVHTLTMKWTELQGVLRRLRKAASNFRGAELQTKNCFPWFRLF